MRDILFRGKRIDNGEWVEGYYVALPDAVGMTHMIHVPRSDPDDSNRTYFIDPDTLGQYTGLTDKNGRMIFEGDIVQWHSLFYPICWIDKYARFAAKPEGAVFAVVPFDQGKVVGNIYDNHDLANGIMLLKSAVCTVELPDEMKEKLKDLFAACAGNEDKKEE